MPSAIGLKHSDRIVVVDGLLAGASSVVAGAGIAGLALLPLVTWRSLRGPTEQLFGAEDVAVLVLAAAVALALLWMHRVGSFAGMAQDTQRAAIAAAADARPMTYRRVNGVLVNALALPRLLVPRRFSFIIELISAATARPDLLTRRMFTLLAIAVLVLPGLGVVSGLKSPALFDGLLLALSILLSAIVVRTQLIAVGMSVLNADIALSEVLFPGPR